MAPARSQPKRKWKRILIPIAVILVLAGSGAGYFFWNQQNSASAQTEEPVINTSPVRRGSLILSASGSGTLTAGQEAELSFPTSGKVAAVHVGVGDSVEAGQVLAEMADIPTLEASLTAAELELKLAEQALADLQSSASANLANAQTALLDAQKAYDSARNSVKEGWMMRCDSDTIEAYYEEWLEAKTHYDLIVEGWEGGDTKYYLNRVKPAKEQVDQAWVTYQTCLKYTAYEIETSHADVTVAEVALNQAQTTLDVLQQNNGIDPTNLAQAQNDIANAKLAYEQAKQNLAGAILHAPFAGTVLSVAGQAGDSVGTDTFITVIDLAHPLVEFSVDETDLDKVKVGAEAEVVFDALPDQTFHGTVLRINPSLETVSGYQVLTGIIQLDLGEEGSAPSLLAGLNASVEIISGKAENVLLVPVEAVRDLGDGQYAVFVVGADGKPRMKVVEVGLMDATFAEIKSGLELGEVVTTGAVETE